MAHVRAALVAVALAACTPPCSAFTKRSVLKKDGVTLVQCNQENACPSGYGCLSNPFVPGTYGCFSGVRADAERRSGACPPAAQAAAGGGGGKYCMFNQDCGGNERCCPASGGSGNTNTRGGGGRFAGRGGGRTRGKRAPGMRMMRCTAAKPVDGRPTLTILVNGVNQQLGSGQFPIKWIGTVTLVQSNGYNVIVDTGSDTTNAKIAGALTDNGLRPDDIDFVLVTHWHPDHSGSVGMFPNAAGAFGALKFNGAVYDAPPFPAKWYLNNDQSLEVLSTPGHSNNDISLLVRNVPGKGSVLIAGDLFLFQTDYNTPGVTSGTAEYQASRKAAGCLADWIVPGHGPMYAVDAAVKQAIGC